MIAGTLEIQMLANMARLQADMDSAKRSVSSAMDSIEKSVGAAKNALGALGIGLSAGAFVAFVNGAIDAADHLNDLTKSTNLTVETLAGLRLASKQSGGDLDSIAASINKLSVNMGKDAEKFARLGVTAKDPLEAFKQLSDIFVKIHDPQLRAAVGAEALGKAWAGAAPLMAEGGAKIQEMVDKGTKLSNMTKEIAERSDAFKDSMEELKAASAGAAAKFIDPLLPSLNDIAKAMAGAAAEGGLLHAALVGLGGAIVGTFSDQLLSRPEKISKDLKALREQLDAELSAPKWLLFSETQKEKHQAQIDAINSAMIALQKELQLIQDTDAAAKEKAKNDTAAKKKEAEETKAAEDAAKDFIETQKKQKDAYEALQKKAADFIKTLEKESAQMGLTIGQKKMIEAALIAATLKTEAERAAVMNAAKAWVEKTEAIEAATAAAKENNRMVDMFLDEEERERMAVENGIKSLREKIEALNEETFSLTATSKQMREHIVLLAMEKSGLDKNTAAYAEMEARLRSALSANEMAREAKAATDAWRESWQNFTRDLESSLTDALMRSFEAGDSEGKAFVDNLKNLIKTAALKLGAQVAVNTGLGVVQNAVNGGNLLTGAGGATGPGALNLISSGNSIYNLATGGSAFSGGISTGAYMASGMGMEQAAMLAAQDSVFGMAGTAATLEAAGSSALAGVAAAAPYIAVALAVASLLGGFGKGHVSRPKEYANTLIGPESSTALNSWTTDGGAQGQAKAGGLSIGDQMRALTKMIGGSIEQGFVLGTHYTQKYNVLAMSVGDSMVKSDTLKQFQVKTDNAAGMAGLPIIALLVGIQKGLVKTDDYIKKFVGDTKFGSGDATVNAKPMLDSILWMRSTMEQLKTLPPIFRSIGDAINAGITKDMVAGLKDRMTAIDTYYGLFYSEAEKFGNVSKQMKSIFDGLNVALPETRDGFKSLVSGIDTTSASGLSLFNSLIDLAPAMDGYYTALQDELNVKKQLAATMNENNFATAVDFRRYQGVAANYDPTLAGDYAYNIRMGAIQPGSAANGDVVGELRALRAEIQAQNVAIATSTQDTAKMLRRWNGDGMPEVRAVA